MRASRPAGLASERLKPRMILSKFDGGESNAKFGVCPPVAQFEPAPPLCSHQKSSGDFIRFLRSRRPKLRSQGYIPSEPYQIAEIAGVGAPDAIKRP